jgi:hypothetical protein
MRNLFFLSSALALTLCGQSGQFRPPAVPLVASDPYFSIWSMTDRLNGSATRHWTGTPQSITSLARVDGRIYRLMGDGRAAEGEALPQVHVQVLPTRTIYDFEGAGVHIALTFMTPALPQDLDIFSRPSTYLTWEARAVDGHAHAAQIYLDASASLAVDSADEPVAWARFHAAAGRQILRLGSVEQPVLKKFGDNLRIDWGYLYMTGGEGTQAAAERRVTAAAFEKNGQLPDADDLGSWSARMPRVLAWAFDLGQIGERPVRRHLVLAYDDVFSLEYFHRQVRPWWRRNGAEAGDLLAWAERDYDSLEERCRRFDEELMADLRRAGGQQYAQMCALAYRQATAAHKLAADIDGTPLFFPKENFSNGCIDTVDVFYPSSPLFLLMNPALLRGSVEPVLRYAEMPRWPWPFAPHDLGTYPLANGQVYGGGERTEESQMPVEESGNLLLLMGGIARAEGNASLAVRHWPLLTKWAEYLRRNGLDPANQLCTDDFAGHLAHNANLSLKAIEALGAYAMLAGMAGKPDVAREWRAVAEDYVKRWTQMAGDGDHYVLAFGSSGTWSQKYNLVWDRILGLNLFPADVAQREVAFYKNRLQRYGLPLDSRKTYTKLDWTYWTAALAESPADFQAFIAPTWKFANESQSRVPLTDWYDTQSGLQEHFQARSVVGGLFVRMLEDPEVWRKWADRARPQPAQ